MLVFGTQVHIVTFLFMIAEGILFLIESVIYAIAPDKRRGWYLVLLTLLLLYNVTGGLFPDPKINISISLQEMIAYGTGFLMASYFPFYFYKAFDLKSLRWHALFGVPLFLMLPYLLFFVIMYAINEDLEKDIRYGVIAPFIYSLVLLWVMLRAIRKHYRENRDRSYYIEELAVYCAVSPWAAMTVLSWFQVSQLTEVLCTNTGFLFISAMFIRRSILLHRLEKRLYWGQAPFQNDLVKVEANCKRHNLTRKETEISGMVCQGMIYRDIADKLFISPRTVDKHIENIFEKVGVTNRVELARKLNGL
ncbi:helix-turn-helix domain-containing protein [Mucilaginibacter paludis]|uniref:Transcriptional regulator, LuxR family n=1 Tax=Mucilaginibacter paludis DSM 18603 TaxID=714943 RepID=H1YIA3_9SPHI|nr:helix-turn-helix transcriptional regulator [Mucilaginibacter paludis]EHQ27516.1 transcriptional regulator, LuxR family [Mucilaginibacter paludis DSM 18603]